jgi:transcriptional regulator with XRE-family HTH domain
MNIGDRLRALREAKNFTQGEVEKRTGVLRTYVSRVENGHAVPSVETLEKFARALEVPTYQLFYESEEPPKLPNLSKSVLLHSPAVELISRIDLDRERVLFNLLRESALIVRDLNRMGSLSFKTNRIIVAG